MAWQIGADEAGYGPNLGPLVVAATVWKTPDPQTDLYQELATAVSRTAAGDRIAIADSKQLYKPGGGLRLLELGVAAAVGEPVRWSHLVDRLGADPGNRRAELPWHEGFDPPLPCDAAPDEIAAARAKLAAACDQAGVGPPRVFARLVFPAEFNQLVEHHGTKGAALSHTTIGLLREAIDWCGEGPIRCVLDKHGGRNRYTALLQHHFPDHWIEPVVESRPQSRYRWDAGRVEATFRTGGEEELPAALASMTAKLLRELAMRALNEYWCARVPDLKPTAGYPVDAKRFWEVIEAKRHELGIGEEGLWRNR